MPKFEAERYTCAPMPILWLMLDTATPIAVRAQASATQQLFKLPDNVSVTAQSDVHNFQTGVDAFDQGVTVRFDVSTITADHVEVDQTQRHAKASGHVHLDDPVATVDADNLEIWWSPDARRGYAENAIIKIGSSTIKARTLDIGPKEWVLTDAVGSTSRAHPAWYEVHSRKVIIKAGKDGKIVKPTLYILGQKIVTLPDRSFNLDQRSEGLTFPGLNYRQDQGLGVSWGGGFLLNHSTDLAFSFGAFPTSLPGYSVSVAHSLLPDEKPTTLITPASDLGERFFYGFLDSVAVSTPTSEDRYIRSPRESVSADSVWNQTTPERDIADSYSKSLEGVYEQGGAVGPFGYMAQGRIQSIRELGQPFTDRALLVGTLAPPAINLAPNLRTLLRVNTNVFLGSSEYGWVRGEAGLSYLPLKQIRLSAGAYFSQDAGMPTYAIDPLSQKNGYVMRADFDLGPTKISYMLKYDDSQKWFDREYCISQVVGCFEPFLLYRQNPSDYQLGLRLRLDDLTDLITKRNFSRPQPVTTKVISPDPNGTP